ncbi:MAG: hypothetical protein COX57_10635 [Alphaproteobacteria bacterium CG_4_10_14_0_2_um_filter_63_37]|nr:MAG: hypothetical protein AUJ55_00315 [Proteobacteria bacterium CG1_02_64_396]PJA24038.1 MAG: hypothetical protein COX57_10635 [Alphaproteobacteria bacterium CG_4_10_14_0_2_um_filter_63_37]
MPPLNIVTFEHNGQTIAVEPGTRLIAAARQAGIFITSDCGGAGECGKCFVTIRDAEAPTPLDLRHVPPDRLVDGARLSCQYIVRRDCSVYIPPGKRRLNRFD